MLVTERPGRLRVVNADGTLSPAVTGLPPVDARNQGGLLDVLLDRQFASNQLIYWSYAEKRDDGTNNTAVARGKFVDGAEPRVDNVEVIYHQAPSLNSRAPLRRPPGVEPRRHAVRDAGRAIDHAGPHAGAADGQPARQDRPHQRRRHDSERQPVRRQGGRPPRDLVPRPSQRPGRDAPSRRPASSGKSSTARAAATRSTSRARARTTAGRPSPTASSTPAARSPAASRRRTAWSSRSTTGIR